jgi:hypothetical protein
MALTEIDNKLLQELFYELGDQPDGVNAARFRAKREDHLAVIDALARNGFIEHKDKLYRLGLLALPELKTTIPQADSLLYLCSHIFQVVRGHYIESPEVPLPLTQLAKDAEQPEPLVRKALRYMLQFPIWAGYSSDHLTEVDAYVMPGESILKYKTLDDCIEQFREQVAHRTAAKALPMFDPEFVQLASSTAQRKYQVFVSSTFRDLQPERQAAVEAILLAGHIPAGMELFSAGNESQLQVIRQWIHESDIFMLILGNRYGSIEPKSQLSYTELEYDHAMSLGKPLFALVLSDAAIEAKLEAYREFNAGEANVEKYAAFKEKVLSKISRHVDDEKDIKLHTMKSIQSIEVKYRLSGWVRGSSRN